jgi:hypothetical protein
VSKWLGICFLITLVIDIISFIIYMFLKWWILINE